MLFSELVGDITIDDTHLKRFMHAWFYPDDIVCVVGMPRYRKGKGGILSYTLPAREIANSEKHHIEAASRTETEEYNIYISVFPMKEDNKVSLHSRGTKADIKYVTGAFADLDIKPGAFESKEQIYSYLASLDLQPTIIVDNGQSGGVHAYWRLSWGQTADEELLHRWWAYLAEKAPQGVSVDRLVDSTRISRAPSFINWSRDYTEKDDTVKVVTAEGPTHDLGDMVLVSSQAYENRKRKISETRERQAAQRLQASTIAKSAYTDITGDTYTGWGATFMLMKIEEHVNENWDWENILCPMGWTLLRELPDNQGREWARPGQNARSATTDYVHDTGEISNVMSLFSQSPDTGLADLKEADIHITKYVALKRLHYNDDEKAMIEDLRKSLKKS